MDTLGMGLPHNKLDGLLQTLIDHNESPDRELYLQPEVEVEVEEHSPVFSTPSKQKSPRTPKSGRKRKCDRYGLDPYPSNSSTVKLFDRSVDLSKYSNPNCSLYPVCRDWIKNSASGTDHTIPDRDMDDMLLDCGPDSIYELPRPVFIKQEIGQTVRDVRITSPLPQVDERLDINSESTPDSELLLVNHMLRWKQIRQKCKAASRRRELPYFESLNILKEMFDKQNT